MPPIAMHVASETFCERNFAFSLYEMSSPLKTAAGAAVVASLLTVIACGSSGDPGGSTVPDDLTSSGSSGASGTSGSSGDFGGSCGSFGSSGTSGGGKECAAQEAAASLTKRPVDIIFVIDNSGSMSGEIAEVEKQINLNFATLIEASKIDYRVIMLAKHGNFAQQSICVAAPLSGTSCKPIPAEPVESAKFFQHSKFISSFNALCRVVDSFSKADDFNKHPTGYGALLRANAAKVIVAITDDRVSTGQQEGCNKPYDDQNNVSGGNVVSTFETDLLALPGAPFGTPGKPNYTFHSIIGVAPFDNADLTKAHPPTAPIVTGKCSPGSENPGTGYQALSVKSGGLRYPSCGLNYTTIFKEIAKGVIEGAKVACEFPVPAAPAGQTLDLATVVPHYTPGAGGAGKDFTQVPNLAACAPDKFYIENNTIKLCPTTCTDVQADPKAAIKVLFGCAVKAAN